MSEVDILREIEKLGAGGESIVICENQDISGGVKKAIEDFDDWSLFVHVAGGIDITVELSPDGGDTWYEIPESPLSYGSSGDDVIEIGYQANMIRLAGSNTTEVTVIVRGAY